MRIAGEWFVWLLTCGSSNMQRGRWGGGVVWAGGRAAWRLSVWFTIEEVALKRFLESDPVLSWK